MSNGHVQQGQLLQPVCLKSMLSLMDRVELVLGTSRNVPPFLCGIKVKS